LAVVAAPPVLPSLPGGEVGPLVVVFPVTSPFRFVPVPVTVLGGFPTSVLRVWPASAGEPCTGGRRVEPFGWADPPGEVVERVDGADVEEPPALPPPLLLEDDCAHEAPAIRQLAIRAVGMVR
jgi:hypothetical protein